MTDMTFKYAWDFVAQDVFNNAASKGFWDNDRNEGEMIALMHSELSEALEAIRHGNGPSAKIPDFSGVEEELADTIIRIMDYGYAKRLDIGGAILAKMEYNSRREHMHGKKF